MGPGLPAEVKGRSVFARLTHLRAFSPSAPSPPRPGPRPAVLLVFRCPRSLSPAQCFPARSFCPSLLNPQTCAQVLVTLDNLADRGQYINVRNTFTELLAYGVVPVVNENVSQGERGAQGRDGEYERRVRCWWYWSMRLLILYFFMVRTSSTLIPTLHQSSSPHPIHTGHGCSPGAPIWRQRHVVCPRGGPGARTLAVPHDRRGSSLHGQPEEQPRRNAHLRGG